MTRIAKLFRRDWVIVDRKEFFLSFNLLKLLSQDSTDTQIIKIKFRVNTRLGRNSMKYHSEMNFKSPSLYCSDELISSAFKYLQILGICNKSSVSDTSS